VGDHITRSADIRVLAATNVDIRQAVAEGRFREDLLYRINVIQIDLPPLRDRADDIPQIAERLLAHFGKQNRKPGLQFNDDAIYALKSYQWPGNVRELRNVIERAVILSRGEIVTSDQLRLGAVQTSNVPRFGDPIPLEMVEELHVRGVLSNTPSIEKAAEILGMDTVTLWRRRKKYGI
jgi:NtrC-family two-component system response regulator AlgB